MIYIDNTRIQPIFESETMYRQRRRTAESLGTQAIPGLNYSTELIMQVAI